MMSDPASLFQDIEGSEFSVFDNLDWSQFRVGTLLIELHAGKGKLKSKPVQELHEFISRIEKAGFFNVLNGTCHQTRCRSSRSGICSSGLDAIRMAQVTAIRTATASCVVRKS
eukprot:FR740395.1.p2 GENE.FR740395.1~~FR740395.1.p2  ORF type:complete len:113 (+),score=3.02 FR740395.1:388-726(+)